MPLLRCTAHRLCARTGSCLIDPLASCSRVAPHNLQFTHVLGTRQFSLFGEAINHSKLLVQCTVALERSHKYEGGQNTALRGEKASARGPVEFECQLSNMCRGFSLTLSLCCSTRAGLLLINGARFIPAGATVLEGPECTHSQFIYHGPHMNQSHLAELLVGHRRPNSPLDDIAHIEAVFFSAVRCFGSASSTWFAHTPVHTIKPELADRIAELVRAFGVDDALAEYVECKAHAVERLERDAWVRVSNSVLPNLE
ncbi:hypothetical protein, conserved [Leishmania donovani]|uniref:Uncharacterized protein n=1 Tax=Leishmania donovani TaxID=5661 RepID=E9BEZ0_LEIDO|nr:hypothetical protein, conserved [Leishmania donovani]AYU78467.1 hypothetical protein LdCL_210005400 [Leishmania donovani]CBZ33816.1 hypothetical protein, conserved [Leishmania donovani]